MFYKTFAIPQGSVECNLEGFTQGDSTNFWLLRLKIVKHCPLILAIATQPAGSTFFLKKILLSFFGKRSVAECASNRKSNIWMIMVWWHDIYQLNRIGQLDKWLKMEGWTVKD